MSDLPADLENVIHLTAVDRHVLSQTDEEFHYHTWDDLRSIIAANDLQVLKRKPSDLKRYIRWSATIQAAYGGMTNFVCRERLHWTPLSLAEQQRCGNMFAYHHSTPFADARDFVILPNDWPYGVAPNIAHLIVWSKTPIEVNPTDGALVPASRRLIDDFVQRTFVQRLGEHGDDRVLWFKNWTQLQSVRGLEHVHVLLRDVPGDVLAQWTGPS